MAQLLTPSALAIETRVPAPTIRNWERKGLITCQKDSNGRRLFNRSAIAVIRKLREQTWHKRRGLEDESDAA